MKNPTATLDQPELAITGLPGLLTKDVDLYMRDTPDDPGNEFLKDYNTKCFWDSPDLWTTGGPLVPGTANTFHARIWNRGTQPCKLYFVSFKLTPFLNTEFLFPDDWVNNSQTTAQLVPILPGQSREVSMPMQVPAALAGVHSCWLASVWTEGDWPKFGLHTWESNNLAQKNLGILEAAPGVTARFQFQAGTLYREVAEMFRLEVLRARKWQHVPVAIVHPDARKVETVFTATNAPAAFLKKDAELTIDKQGLLHLAYPPGLRAGFPVTLPAKAPVALELGVAVPKDAKPGDVIDTHLVQRNRENKVVGGFTARVNVVAKH